MENRNWTRGRFITDGTVNGRPWTVHVICKFDDLGPSNGKIATAEDIDGNIDTRIANAALIADAFNTAHKTDRTPSELAALVERMREVLEEVRDELFQRVSDRHDPKTAYHWPEIQKADNLLAELDAKPKEKSS